MRGPDAATAEPPLAAWADALEAAARGTRFERVRVLAETASTQDAAARLGAGRPGLIVCAGRQIAGRGRHGRRWADTEGLGLAVTFVVDGALDDRTLALAGGLAALRAAEAALKDMGPSVLGLKWPNDVIERAGAPGGAGAPRKLAGVLVERRGGLALLGIGMNVGQREGDWPAEVAPRCVSLQMLGARATRLDIACRLTGELESALGLSPAGLDTAWRAAEIRPAGAEWAG